MSSRQTRGPTQCFSSALKTFLPRQRQINLYVILKSHTKYNIYIGQNISVITNLNHNGTDKLFIASVIFMKCGLMILRKSQDLLHRLSYCRVDRAASPAAGCFTELMREKMMK